jgi:curved DNA-binding protein CbpA
VARTSAPSPSSLVLADSPLRARLLALKAETEALRDAVAALDLDIETLRTTLSVFDARAHGALREVHACQQRLLGVVRHLERWTELLATAPPADIARRAVRLETRRARQLQTDAVTEVLEEPEEAEAVQDEAAELKSLYRRLARRYHPDLARDEEEHLLSANLMVRINALYRAQDLAGLRALADQALGAEPAEEGLTLEREVALLESRCFRFQEVLEGLQEELAALEGCPLARLWEEVTAREAAGGDAFSELRRELGARTREGYEDVRVAAHALEEAVRRYNRSARELAATGGRSRALGRVFDAHARQPLVRWTLAGLSALRASKQARERAEWLLAEAGVRPALVRLVLFTYAVELVPEGLETLGSLEGLRARFDTVSGGKGPRLEEALVDAVAVLEFGVRRAGPKLVQTGLRFRDAGLAEAVPLALKSHALRAEFRKVLAVLGEAERCPACARDVFGVPLYRLRGLDDLHSSVCPSCGETLKSYWMPRGKDVQAVLNDAFLDLELLTEWTFRLGRAPVSTQLLPSQLETLSVGDLKRRFVADVLERHGVGVGFAQVRLLQGKTAVPERRLLADVPTHSFSVAFSASAKVSVADALERVRFRIRTRFRPEAETEGATRKP